MTAKEAKQYLAGNDGYGYFKYVKVCGEYRFAESHEINFDHGFLANNETVESAAHIQVNPSGVKIEGYSMKLKIGPDAADYERLPELFGLPLLWDFD